MPSRIRSSVVARRLFQAGVDACLIELAWWLAFMLRFDQATPERYQDLLQDSIAFVVVGKLILFAANGLYHKLWRFIDAKDFETIVRAVVRTSFALVVVFFLLPSSTYPTDPPRGIIALDFLLSLAFIAGSRFMMRAVSEGPSIAPKGGREVLIVGAGNGGQLVAAELRRNPDLGGPPRRVRGDEPRQAGLARGGL